MADHAFNRERLELVEILRKKGITDERVLAAIGSVHRHRFVQTALVHRAYEDVALPIGLNQTISQPYTVAVMTQVLSVTPGDRILEIGTGSGYQAAILSSMGCQVFTIERHLELMNQARMLLETLGHRVVFRCADGTLGWSQFAPYNGIVVTAGAPVVPHSLLKQLKPGGRLVIPVGDERVQNLKVIRLLDDNRTHTDTIEGFKFVPLIGVHGWKP